MATSTQPAAGAAAAIGRLDGDGSTADILLETLAACGVDYIFANFGTDYPAIIESIARHGSPGLPPIPRVVLAQHEMAAISAATGYAQVTGRPQAVMVHVDVGTANLGAGVHNACRTRVPVLIFAGLAPLTAHGELTGGRDNVVHYVQDVYDQPGIVRQYVKFDYELRTPHQAAEIVARALQLAAAAPAGPVYLTGSREVMEQRAPRPAAAPATALPELGAATPQAVEALLQSLRAAERPLLVTSYAGQQPGAVEALVRFAERFGVGVVETRVRCVNFPTDHPLHLGFAAAPLLAGADLVLVVDSDVPWVPSRAHPAPDTTIVRIDADPLISRIPYHAFPATRLLQGSAALILDQLSAAEHVAGEAERIAARGAWCAERHRQQRQAWSGRAESGDRLTAARLSRIVAEAAGDDALFVNEAVTNAGHVLEQMPRRRAGQLIENGGSGLGWGLGAAFGARLARGGERGPVVALLGDGAYFFGVPAAVHWAQRAYDAPFLTVLYNNAGWQAVENALLTVHPSGDAARSGETQSRFPEPPELSRVVAMVDGYGCRVDTPAQAEAAVAAGLEAVRRGVPAVIDARLAADS